MRKIVSFTEQELTDAGVFVKLCKDILDQRPIADGMIDALKVVLEWRGLVNRKGRPVNGLFSAPMQEFLDRQHEVNAARALKLAGVRLRDHSEY